MREKSNRFRLRLSSVSTARRLSWGGGETASGFGRENRRRLRNTAMLPLGALPKLPVDGCGKVADLQRGHAFIVCELHELLDLPRAHLWIVPLCPPILLPCNKDSA